MQRRRGPVFRHPFAVVVTIIALGTALAAPALIYSALPAAADPCAPIVSPVACENTLPGTPTSDWQIQNAGDPSIQGFATQSSVQAGDTVHFKILTPSTSYHLDILRIGYYGGLGARKITAGLLPSATLPQSQPACLVDSPTGLIDCGNWADSATWTVPAGAVSGVYIAHLVRNDAGGSSHIMFVVRKDTSHSKILYQTSDTTREAYNRYGGNSLYFCSLCPTGGVARAAYKVSFNRPNTAADVGPEYSFFNGAEFQQVQWLERNGYDVSYMSGVDTDRGGAPNIEQHSIFMSSGHDEYWSGAQRANVEAARDASPTHVNLAFFSGNESFWKIRYENSADGTNTPYRTEVSYKETYGDAHDPLDPPVSTATWRDTRFGAPADGARPENSMSGTLFMVDGPNSFAMQVPAADGKMRFWRNTSVASQAAGATATLAPNTLGYEWDVDLDNGSRPAGLFHLSTTTKNVTALADQGFGTVVRPGMATHNMTFYKAPSGALVFASGTVQWSWGLSGSPDGTAPSDSRMQQATVNLLADMGAQPATLQSGLVAATPSGDSTAPTSVITSPTDGENLPSGSVTTITGTASDVGGEVAGVEVSTDGGATWHPATGRANWSYDWQPTGTAPSNIRSRAVDDSGNVETSGPGITVHLGCPCSLWSTGTTPGTVDGGDSPPAGVEVGVKFTSDSDGFVTGVRFYKAATNTGTHTGTLWSSTGTQLATVTFAGESGSGWQQATFSSPVAVTAGTTYVVSYHTSSGHYSFDSNYFAAALNHAPLHGVASGPSGGNGVFHYGASAFPSQSFHAANYWVDLEFVTNAQDTTPPAVTTSNPAANATNVSTGVLPSATFSEAVQSNTITFTLQGPGSTDVPGSMSYANNVATFTPSAALAASTVYTATVSGAQDLAGNTMVAPFTWTFTTGTPNPCPCSIWSNATTPGTVDVGDPGANVELGVKFTSDTDGFVTGVKFYKSLMNTGTHTGTLWTSTGTQLATVTFAGESGSGWQQATFSSPVAVTAGTTYVVSYHTNAGHYSYDSTYFVTAVDHSPLHALASTQSAGNGVYLYGSSAFPNLSYRSSNYWVDVVFSQTASDTTPPTVIASNPVDGATAVATNSVPSATFSEAVQANTILFTLQGPGSTNVNGSVAYANNVTTFTPSAPLAASTLYTATVSGAQDLAGNTMTAPFTWTFTTASASGPGCPCSLWSAGTTPGSVDGGESGAVEVGAKFTSDSDGFVTAVRFYKAPTNTGTHTGTLWSSSGTQLATVTFAGESGSGWQQATFSAPVAVSAGTTYVISYHTTSGHYSYDSNYFASALDRAPLHGLASGPSGGNGVYRYGASAFPSLSFNAANYWVDVVFSPSAIDTTPPSVTTSNPAANATNVATGVLPSATFSEAVQPATITFTLQGPGSTNVAGSVAYANNVATFTPSAPLAASTVYTATVSGAKDLAGNTMVAPFTWTFTTAAASGPNCPCSIWAASTTPGTVDIGDPGANVELGVKFASDTDGSVTGVKFYKSLANTGTHTGTLWSSTGTPLATVTFPTGTSSGWQQATFSAPVAVTAGTTYVVSYHTTSGHYSYDSNYFAVPFDDPPLHALASGASGGNGVYRYGASAFPDLSFNAANYWVDVLFSPGGAADTTPPTVTTTNPAAGATGVATNVGPTATFSEAVQANTILFILQGPGSTNVAGSVAYANNVATFTPSAALAESTVYTATVSGTQDLAGNTMTAPFTWTFTTVASANQAVVGSFGAVMPWPLTAVHSSLLNTGNVLIWDAWQPNTPAKVFHPDSGTFSESGTFTDATMPSRIFCSGMVTLGDGRIMVVGGHSGVEGTGSGEVLGIPETNIFDPATNTWTRVADMHFPRWYPGVTLLADGRVLAVSGLVKDDQTWADTPEVYDPQTDTWTLLSNVNTAALHQEEYPLTYLMPDGRVFIVAPETGEGLILDVDAQTLTATGTSGIEYASGAQYRPGKYLYAGGGDSLTSNNPASTSASVMDTTAAQPAWQATAPMQAGRMFHTFTNLPDGKVLTIGGSAFDNVRTQGVLAAEEWDPTTGAWTTLASMDVNREYHSTAVLMPDGRVLVSGGGLEHSYMPGTPNAQYYSPPYLFKGARPTITSVDHPVYTQGATINVATPDAANIASVSLIDLATSSHTADWSQHFVPLSFTAGSGTLNVSIPGNAGVVPPGEYMLFIVKANGVPSVAKIIRVTGTPRASGFVVASAGSGSATVAWATPINGGSAITGYTVTPFNGNTPLAPTSVPATSNTTTIGGLTNGVAYTFKVTASNEMGAGTQSAASNAVTPGAGSPPGAPTSVVATAGLSGTTVTWTAPSSGGSPITQYLVTPFSGSSSLPPTAVNGTPPSPSAVVHGLTPGSTYTFKVQALNNLGPGPSSAPSNAIVALNECPCSLLGPAIPGVPDAGPDPNVELGLKFTADTNGSITGVRFFKSTQNTGVHTGTLWTAAGVQLATVTFSGESSSGWQQASFSTPVNVTAGVTYVVSYHTTVGHYASDSQYFANQVDASPLHAPSSAAAGGNGVYKYGASAFPDQSFNAANYWVDVVFTPGQSGQLSSFRSAGAHASAKQKAPTATTSPPRLAVQITVEQPATDDRHPNTPDARVIAIGPCRLGPDHQP